MMRKIWIAAAAAAAIAGTMATGAFAQGNERIEAEGIAFEIPEALSGRMTVKTDEDGMLVSVYETASLEAAEALGEEYDGAGWIFGISRLPESEVKELRCEPMDGMEVFAEDDDFCYILNHPTDVRVVREAQEDYEEGLEQYGELFRWAQEDVPEQIRANNPELDAELFTNTTFDMFMAQAAYREGTNYEVISLEFGGKALPLTDAKDHLEELAEDFIAVEAEDETAPDGEYIVLSFPDANIRFDFFQVEGGEAVVREVNTIDGEEHETLYNVFPKDFDENDTPVEVMQDWVRDILEGDDD